MNFQIAAFTERKTVEMLAHSRLYNRFNQELYSHICISPTLKPKYLRSSARRDNKVKKYVHNILEYTHTHTHTHTYTHIYIYIYNVPRSADKGTLRGLKRLTVENMTSGSSARPPSNAACIASRYASIRAVRHASLIKFSLGGGECFASTPRRLKMLLAGGASQGQIRFVDPCQKSMLDRIASRMA